MAKPRNHLTRASLQVLVSFAVLAAFVTVLALQSPAVRAAQLLDNPGFEAWNGASPASWMVRGATPSAEGDHTIAGTSVALAGSQSAVISQVVSATPGASYSGSVYVALGPDTGAARLSLRFLDGGFGEIGAGGSATTDVGEGFRAVVAVPTVAPVGTEFILFELVIEHAGAFTAYVDEASLSETPGEQPTPTPVLPTDTPTPTRVPATPTPRPTKEPPAGGSAGPAATRSATATRTPTAKRRPTSTKTPTPPKQPTSTKTPKQPTATRTPASHAPSATPAQSSSGGSSFGGLLYNGDFEDEDAGKPAGWSKYGGTLGLTTDARSGANAATLDSDTSSTKWVFQSAPAEPGRWYSARAYGRVDGGEVFVRLSWYPGADGGGAIIDQADSEPSASNSWSLLDTGPVQAPADAVSVRVRLMLRPYGPASAAFDDVELFETDAPPPATATPPPATTTPRGQATKASNATPTHHPSITGAGGSADPSSKPAAVPSPLSGANTLRLSEVMPLADVSNAGAEHQWIELLNAGGRPISTAGWRIDDGQDTAELPAFTVPAGAFVVVAAPKAALPVHVTVLRLDAGFAGIGLTAGALHLIAPDGSEADAISFGDDTSVFEPSLPSPGAGQTLGLRVFGTAPDAANWALTEYPTPGEANVFVAPQSEARSSAASAVAPEPHTADGWGTLEWGLAAAGSVALVGPLAFVRYWLKHRPKDSERDR